MSMLDRKILLKKEVKSILRISADSAFDEMWKQHDFPKPIRIGIRRTGWYADEVEGWLKERDLERLPREITQ
ncbi:AlpA family phage regulatory protein [Candidatus Fukatsuia symbiotica]|uniref:Transcriptional regulator n=1 Tax=Candidatus Fukatsuia symbiotica TaxID=1878942 RepID=A0A2U8I554_9GAMM|nr:AlpA family phage regulatory protein [Candidatus Fukatsuia symbiotica]AWK14259.1 transcriptional regulator [Candidatus Fukatsuia symbiotica]MEA9444507.1 AlpA family phage regulatory protein [Candidatus Fukatsuia symbiotica]